MDELIYDVINSETELNPTTKVQYDLNNIPLDSDELLVQANPDLFYVAFSNIVSNAIKYGNEYPIRILLDFDHKNVIIKVMDQGIGIPASDLPNIFYSFYRASNVGDIYGNGLGLVLARNIFTLHDVELSLESDENIGTTVTIKIPKPVF